MRSYFVTVRNASAALAIDPKAVLVRTLPATRHVRGYCCREAEHSPVPPAYIYKVQVTCRRKAEHATGVIKCRAKEPAQYKKVLYSQVC